MQPFVTQEVVRGPDFTDRDREVVRVVRAMEGGDRLVLYGERRMGKSSVIAHARGRFEEAGGRVIAVDAWTVGDLGELNAALLRAVPGSWLVGERLSRLLDVLRSAVSVSVDEEGRPVLRLAGRPDGGGRGGDAATTLGRILRGIDVLAHRGDRPVAVVIDEFQRLAEVHEGAGGVLRSAVQETSGVGYVFAGSAVGLVMGLIGPRGPFHAIDRLEVAGIARDHLVPWLRHRFESNGVRISEALAGAIYDRGGPVTEYVMRLAKVTYLRAVDGAVVSGTIDDAFAEVVADYEGSFELIWDGLASSKRQVLRAVAAGEQQLTSRAVMDRHGLSSSASASYAVLTLRQDGILAPGKPFRISDPFFAEWVRATSP